MEDNDCTKASENDNSSYCENGCYSTDVDNVEEEMDGEDSNCNAESSSIPEGNQKAEIFDDDLDGGSCSDVSDVSNDLEEMDEEELNAAVFSCLPCVALGFDIIEEGKRIWEIHQRQKTALIARKSEKIYPGAEEGSKVEFCSELNSILIRHHSTIAMEDDLIEFLKRRLNDSFINIPYEPVMYSEDSNHLRGYKSTLSDYCPPIDPHFAFDACRNGCCVFIGPNLREYLCPNCKEPRYRQCSTCKAAEDQMCKSSLIGEFHIACKSRLSLRVVKYRPLINILRELLSDQSFRSALAFDFEDTFEEVKYSDILKGKTWLKHKAEMRNVYNEFIGKGSGQRADVEEISLYLSLIFDGVKLFDSAAVPCWPLGVSIQNLPPHLRGKPGIGAFLVSLITTNFNSSSSAEHCRGVGYFIFRDCFMQELLALQNGIHLTGNDPNNPEDHVFLQCRLLLSVLDGRGLEEFFHYQGANSKAGCAICSIMKGRHSEILGKTIYGESRNLLPYRHETRYFGQSKSCCPKDSIDGGIEHADVGTNANGIISDPIKLKKKDIIQNNKNNNINWNILCCAPRSEHEILSNVILELFDFTTTSWSQTWYHADFKTNLFTKYLYYAHCDFREYVPKLPVNHWLFLISSIKAQRYFNIARDKARINTIPFVNKVHNQKNAPKNGFKGLCILFLLTYFRVNESVCYDALHVLKNIILYVIWAIKGQSAVGDSVAMHSKLKGLHRYLWAAIDEIEQLRKEKSKKKKNGKKTTNEEDHEQETKNKKKKKIYGPWYVSPRGRGTFDYVLETMYIPTGESGSYELTRGVFRQTGNLKSIALIRLLINYMDLLVFVCKMEDSYGEFLSMLSADICRLFEPMGTAEDIEQDTNRVNETVAVMEGLFPESERNFTVHELVHLSGFRRMQGALRNTWTASAERFVGKVAEFVKEGGRSYDKTIWRKYLAFEVDSRSRFHDSLFENKQKSPFLRLERNSDTNESKLLFSDCRYFLCNDAKEKWSFYKDYFLFGSMILALLLEIERQSTSAAHAMRSPVYQLLQIFLCIYERKELLKYVYVPEEFAKWIIKSDISKEITKASTLLFYQQPVDVEAITETKRLLCCHYQKGLQYFKNAFVGGQKFTSRGCEFQQSQRPELDHNNVYPPTIKNKIQTVLKTSKGCDSLSKILVIDEMTTGLGDLMKRDYQLRDRTIHSNAPYYGNHISFSECAASLNCFVRINISNCPILKEGIPFAAVNAWKISRISEDRIDLINCNDRMSYLPGVKFVPLIQIVPTRIALSCMDINYDPLSSKKMSSVISKWIVLLDMDRTRRAVQRMINKKIGRIYDDDTTVDLEVNEV
jgi:hypothetical protein